jgi:hypothetical protein
MPETFIMPKEINEFKAAFKAGNQCFIWKPNASARGIGIKLITKLEQVPRSKVTGEVKGGQVSASSLRWRVLEIASCEFAKWLATTMANNNHKSNQCPALA